MAHFNRKTSIGGAFVVCVGLAIAIPGPSPAPPQPDHPWEAYPISPESFPLEVVNARYGFNEAIRNAALVPLVSGIVAEKPTHHAEFDVNFTDSEYARFGQLVDFTGVTHPALMPSDLPLLRKALESTILDQVAVMILVHYGQIIDISSARSWLTDAQLAKFLTILLHSNVEIEPVAWEPIIIDALLRTGTRFSFGMSEQLHAMMSLLYCRFGEAITPSVLLLYLTLVADLDLFTIHCATFRSLEAVDCRYRSHSDLVIAMLENDKNATAILFRALKSSISSKAFLDWPMGENHPRHFPTWSETWSESYSTDTFIELMRLIRTQRGWDPRSHGVSELILHAHWSMESAQHDEEWVWTTMGFRHTLRGDVLSAARERRLQRTRILLDRLQLLELQSQ